MICAICKEDIEDCTCVSPTPADIQEQFGLYAPRTKGKSQSTARSVVAATGQTVVYHPVEIQRLQVIQQDTFGFLVVIPVPLRETYTRGGDRHPLTLVRKYVKAICTLMYGYDPRHRTEETALAFASNRIRILLCINSHNDYRTDVSSDSVASAITEFVDGINQEFLKIGYPAWLLSTVWSIAPSDANELMITPEELRTLGQHVDLARRQVSLSDVRSSSFRGASFPFANFRSFLMSSDVAVSMMKELAAVNGSGVYVITGDADLVSLHPGGNKRLSIFNSYHDALCLTRNRGERMVRFGGSYSFNSDEVSRNIRAHYSDIALLPLMQSVLFTQLAKTLDTAIRRIFAMLDDSLAYFAEPATGLTTQLYDTSHFSFNLGSTKARAPETSAVDRLRNSRLGEPDHTAQITRGIRQSSNWAAQSPEPVQRFISRPSAQLESSSRHDLIVVAPSPQGRDVGVDLSASVYKIFKCFGRTHNTQITRSQQNSRWNEAGYGDQTLAQLLGMLDPSIIPIVYLFWYSKKMKTDRTAEAEKAQRDISTCLQEDIDREYREGDLSIEILMKNIEAVAARSGIEHLSSASQCTRIFPSPHLIARLTEGYNPSGITNRQFEPRAEAFITAIFNTELLFRWAFRKIIEIQRIAPSQQRSFENTERKMELETRGSQCDAEDFALYSRKRSRKEDLPVTFMIEHAIPGYQSSQVGSISFYSNMHGFIRVLGEERQGYVLVELISGVVETIGFGQPTVCCVIPNSQTETFRAYVLKELLLRLYQVNMMDFFNQLLGHYIGQQSSQRSQESESRMREQEQAAQEKYHALQSQGYHLIEIDDDGNCAFGAVSAALNSGNQTQHEALRRTAIQYMRNHMNVFRNFGINEHYISNMERLGTWAGSPEIYSLALALGRRIVVHSPQSTLVFPTHTPYDDSSGLQSDIHVFYNGYNHYWCMKKI
jgi:hypothetical protein